MRCNNVRAVTKCRTISIHYARILDAIRRTVYLKIPLKIQSLSPFARDDGEEKNATTQRLAEKRSFRIETKRDDDDDDQILLILDNTNF